MRLVKISSLLHTYIFLVKKFFKHTLRERVKFIYVTLLSLTTLAASGVLAQHRTIKPGISSSVHGDAYNTSISPWS